MQGNVNGSVSVIDPYKNSVIKTIPVGNNPKSVSGILRFVNSIYVANSGSDTVSVIDTTNNTVIKTISVGNTPSSIFRNSFYSNLTYVAYSGSDTVSVIGVNTYNVTNIHVGQSPSFVFGSPSESDTVFVANTGSNGVAVINSMKKEVVAGVAFNLIPFKSGSIICDTDLGRLDAPMSHFFYVTSGAKCTAKPSKGFEFSSWSESLNGNSTRTVSASSGSNWTRILTSSLLNSMILLLRLLSLHFLTLLTLDLMIPQLHLPLIDLVTLLRTWKLFHPPCPNIGLRYLV